MRRPLRYRGDALGNLGDAFTDQLLPLFATSLAKTVEIRTNATPPLVLDVGETLAPGTSPTMAALQPTVIFDGGSLGRQVVAPYGVASGNGAAVGLGLAGLLFGLGYYFGKRKGRRGG